MRLLFDEREVLDRLTDARALFVFDFDGTLAPIVEHRDDAMMRDSTRELMRRLSEIAPCAIITGRSRADILPRLAGVRLVRIIGNHGAESDDRDPKLDRIGETVGAWADRLSFELGGVPGVSVENKGLSISLHFRAASDQAEAERRVREAASKIAGALITGGKCVVNLTPPDAPHKGDALRRVRDEIGASVVFFLGDDVTDESIFALPDEDIVSVRVGADPDSRAPFFIRDQDEVDRLLAKLVRLRE
ncbi:trehalose-phosphatase [bacterium]|nr:trehalose-phosphatase [bacterium]